MRIDGKGWAGHIQVRHAMRLDTSKSHADNLVQIVLLRKRHALSHFPHLLSRKHSIKKASLPKGALSLGDAGAIGGVVTLGVLAGLTALVMLSLNLRSVRKSKLAVIDGGSKWFTIQSLLRNTASWSRVMFLRLNYSSNFL